MNKKTFIIIIIVVILIALGAGGYFYWSKKTKTDIVPGSITDSVTKGVLPSINTNPLENKPDINPADKANPFTNIKINPF